MKKTFILSLCSLLGSISLQAQDLENVMRYNYEYKIMHTDPQPDQDPHNSFNMVLDVSGEYSRFAHKNNLEMMSLREQMIKNSASAPEIISNMSKLRVAGQRDVTFRIYKEPKEIATIETVRFDSYYIVDPSDDIQWEILPEVFTYHDFNVQKATAQFAGRTWEVYFTQDIPLFEGPYKFKNLPGMVVFAQDATKEHTFTFLNSEKITLDQWKFDRDEKAIPVNKKQFNKAKKIAQNTPIEQSFNQRAGARGTITSITPVSSSTRTNKAPSTTSLELE